MHFINYPSFFVHAQRCINIHFTSISALQEFRKLHAKLFQIKANKEPKNIHIAIQENRETNKVGRN